MDYGFRFREWDIYKDALKLRRKVAALLKTYPQEERYALPDQTRRALTSIVLNIAEGSNKNTDKDMRLYMNRAHGSLDEVVACLDCALSDGYVSHEQHAEILEESSSLAKRLNAFAVHLSKVKSERSIVNG